jgi:hypothetical protein
VVSLRTRGRLAVLTGLALAAARCGGGGSDGGTIPTTGAVRLLDVQAQVFTPRCALSGCHVGGTAPFGLELGAGQAAGKIIGVASGQMPSMLRVAPGSAADSYLYWKVSGDPRILGDPMPLSGGPLSAADLALIEDWIDQGAQL